MTNPSVFVSRKLKPDSPFRAILEKNNFEIVGESMVQFNWIPCSFFPRVDCIFFYSRNGVINFFKNKSFLREVGQNNNLLATMGKGTAKELLSYGCTPDFVGNGQPAEVAKAFLDLVKGKTVLFVKAQNSKNSIRTLLETEIECEDLVVYQNEVAPIKLNQGFDYYVFTSPLNVEAFFSVNEIEPGSRIIAIGQTTASFLESVTKAPIYISDFPTEESLAQKVITLN